MYKKYFLIAVLNIAIVAGSKAQVNPLLDSIKNELYRINKVFDSSAYLGFNMNIHYYTDSCALSCNLHQYKNMEYQLNNKSYYYKTDNLEYMQNDSFTVSIDHDDKTLIATPTVISNQASTNFLLKDFVQYSLGAYDSLYTINIGDLDSVTREITFQTTAANMPFIKLAVLYDIETYQPLSIETVLGEKLVYESTVPTPHTDTLIQQTKITFSNYHTIPTGKIFDETIYFTKSRTLKKYVPAEKYKYYEFITAGLDEEPLQYNPQLLQDNKQ